MKKKQSCITCVLIHFLLSFFEIHAQIKGDPVPTGLPASLTYADKDSSKLSAPLVHLYNSYDAPASHRNARLQSQQNFAAIDKYMMIQENMVLVDITIKIVYEAARAELADLGLQLSGVYGRVVSGMIPIESIPLFNAAEAVKFVRPAYKIGAQYNPLAPSGDRRVKNTFKPVITQGDTALHSYQARKKYRVTGRGIKVGILSDSYDNSGSAALGVANGELPGPGNPFRFYKPVNILKDLSSNGTDEGRAMAEIVHDIAPGAQISFYTSGFGQADFANGILELDRQGCKVIVDDAFYFAEPFFQDGIVAQAVDEVKEHGVSYFTAAGNNSIKSYESDYRPTLFTPFGPQSGTAHNFNGLDAESRFYQPIDIPVNGSFITSFQWDQPFFSAGGTGAASDMDIYLLDEDLNIVASGVENNISSGDPLEVLSYFNGTSGTVFYLAIVKYRGQDPTRLKYIHFGDASFYLTTPAIPGIFAPTIFGHANASGAITTAASFYKQTPAYGIDTPKVELFSSVGGVANYFDVAGNRLAPSVRKKPEITAPDGVNTSFFTLPGSDDISDDADDFPNFFGTSAAAPHAAGVAALMMEAQKLKSLTPGQVKGILAANTVDMDDPYTPGFDKGFDFATGKGLIKADAAIAAVRFPAVYIKDLSLKAICSDDPGTTRKWIINNYNPFEVKVHWFLAGFSQHGNLILQPGETTFTTQTAYYYNRLVPNMVIIDWEDNLGFLRFDIGASTRATCGVEEVSANNTDIISEQVVVAELVDKANSVTVYPNPSSNNFRVYLSFARQQNIDLSLYTIDGKLLFKKIARPGGVIDIDASGYKPGMYILKVKQQEFNKTIKLIKY